MSDDLRALAALMQERDGIEAEIAKLTKRSARLGDIGEFIASEVFAIDLAPNAVQAGYDGRFGSGQLAGRTVNVKTYGDAAGGIDISPHKCDFYLVLSGPPKPAGPVAHHRWRLTRVFLFESALLLAELADRGVKVGVATSLRMADLAAAQIYPGTGSHPGYQLTAEQQEMLAMFA